MRRITTWLLSTTTALVLLFSYHTSTNPTSTSVVAAGSGTAAGGSADGSSSSGSTSDDASGTTGGPSSGSTGGASSGSTDTQGSSGTSGTTAATTYTGAAVSTRYGDVQVEITVTDGKVTDARVTQVPWSDHRDQEINARAVPVLNAEAVDAQGADIDMVSGATYTSQGYIGSLQSALDAAGL